MGYLKQKYLEGLSKDEIEVTLQKYDRRRKLTDEEQKKIDDMIDCQIEDAKIRRDEKEGKEY